MDEKNKIEGDMHGLFLNCYVSIKWETITDSKVFIQCDGLGSGE